MEKRELRKAVLILSTLALTIVACVSQPTKSEAPTVVAPKRAASNLPAVPEALMQAELRALDGGMIRLADYAGKVIVLDLWATWCPPCRYEIPHLVALGNEYRAQGVEVIGLTVDERDTEQKLRAFASQFGINYKIGWADADFAYSLMGDYSSIPQTFIITRDGRLLKKFVGFDPQRGPQKLRDAIEQALREG